MVPIVRSFVAQVRSSGARRKFSSAASATVAGLTGTSLVRGAARIGGTYGGYCLCDVLFGDIGEIARKKNEKNMKEVAEDIQKVSSE